MLLSRKRPHSPDPIDEHSCRRNNCASYMTFVLESESPVPTDEDSESLNSVQLAGTASAKDTSDTSWSSESTVDVELEEYDVASVTHSDEKLMSNCDSSGSDDLLRAATAATVVVAANLCEERDLWADSSDVESDATTDSEVPRADYWECVRCKSKCTPLFRYCLKCFQLEKTHSERNVLTEKLFLVKDQMNVLLLSKLEMPQEEEEIIKVSSCVSSCTPSVTMVLDFQFKIKDMLHTDTATTTKVAVNLCEERDIWADSSNVESDATTDSEIPHADYWECVRCKSKCTPLLRYCLKCFQLRKGYFPERPKRIHPRRRKAEKLRPGSDLAKASSATSDTERIHSSASESLTEDPGALTRGDSGISVGTVEEGRLDLSPKGTEIAALSSSGNREPEPDRRSELCFMCVERPKTGGFVHKKTVHVLGCYQCSLQVWNRTRRCPLCNKRPQNVARVIFG